MRCPYLSSHTESNGDENLGAVVETAETVDQATAALGLSGGFDEVLALGDVFLLELGDMEEASVGGVEQRNTAGNIGTHDPVLAVTGHQGTDHETELANEPVQVKKNNCRERQTKASNSENG